MDETTLRLLTQLLSPAAHDGSAPSLDDLVAQGALSPRQQLLASMLLQQPAPEAAEPARAERRLPAMVSGRNPGGMQRAQLRTSLQAVREELAALRGLNDSLAFALGACAVCWGGDERCGACQGRGSPGWAQPDRALFRALVQPAVDAIASSAATELPQPADPGRDDVEVVMTGGNHA